MQLAVFWMNEEWYNDQIRIEKDPEWVCVFIHAGLMSLTHGVI